ncbi:MAG: hypothetical protein KF716_08670 [Anaerolineae bacterium]|nr:hypothetical protein [Anaerolineae bacterium]
MNTEPKVKVIRCPMCQKQFNELHEVTSNSTEPFTCVEAITGLEALSAIWVPKEIVCHDGRYTHFRFTESGEERLVKINQFNQEALAKSHQYHDEHPQLCNEEGCSELGIPCYLNWLHPEPDDWYCTKHAHDQGYCPGCGLFHAGIESFDFSKSGYCANCEDQFSEADDFDDDDY